MIVTLTTSRNKPSVAFWETVVVVVGLAYVASVGPALSVITLLPDSAKEGYVAAYYVFYTPLIWLCDQAKWIEAVMAWYADLWV